MLQIEGVITVQELREEVGDPTTDVRFAGNVTDEMLKGIIDRHTAQLERLALQRLEEGRRKPVKDLTPVQVDVSTDTAFPGLGKGRINGNYFPYATKCIVQTPSEHQGRSLQFDGDIMNTVGKSPFTKYRFSIEDQELIISPSDVTKVTVMLAKNEDAIAEMTADVLDETNKSIIESARFMIEARAAEFGRETVSA